MLERQDGRTRLVSTPVPGNMWDVTGERPCRQQDRGMVGKAIGSGSCPQAHTPGSP